MSLRPKPKTGTRVAKIQTNLQFSILGPQDKSTVSRFEMEKLQPKLGNFLWLFVLGLENSVHSFLSVCFRSFFHGALRSSLSNAPINHIFNLHFKQEFHLLKLTRANRLKPLFYTVDDQILDLKRSPSQNGSRKMEPSSFQMVLGGFGTSQWLSVRWLF